MSPMLRAYVASPYGFAESTRLWYDTVLLPLVARHVEVLDPWAQPLGDETDPVERWLGLGARHLATISERADLVVAGLDQEPADAGTLVELAWAASRGLPVIAYRNDLRRSGEEGLRYNLMIGAAVRASGGTEVADLDAPRRGTRPLRVSSRRLTARAPARSRPARGR